MPRVVWILGFAILVQGTSELMVAGLLPEIAGDLGVSLPDAGLLISGFAVGMLVGAPLLAVLTRRLPRRATLLALLGVFAVAHVVGALAPGYGLLLASRVVGAFVYAGFWAVASATAVSAVPPAQRGRAMSVVVGGLTVSVLVGLPAGTALGQLLGWRAAFWAVAIGSALVAAAVTVSVSDRPGGTVPRPLRRELADLASPALGLAWATIALATAGLLATYGYLAPIITDGVGLAPGWVPPVLALYGVGAVTGIVLGGRAADRNAVRTQVVGLSGLAAVSVALAATVPAPAVTVPLIALLGLVGFLTNPALQVRVFGLAGEGRDLAAAGSVAAFNVGIALGPWLGGLVLGSATGPLSVAWVGLVASVLALVAAMASVRFERRTGTKAPLPPSGDTKAPFATAGRDTEATDVCASC